MCKAYLEDVTEAIIAAVNNFENNIEGPIEQHFERASVNVMFERRGDRWDYGHPAMYKMDSSNIDKLATWWKEIYPTGGVLPRVWKDQLQCYEVNVQWVTSSGRMFNYHVAVT